MLLSLRWMFERHPGVTRQVVWPRVKTALTRQTAYERLLAADGIFVEDAGAVLREGTSYALRATTGETYSGKAEFRRDGRGFCLSVRELNDSLLCPKPCWFMLKPADALDSMPHPR